MHVLSHSLTQVLADELGPEWDSLFDNFEFTPIAAASIGQVNQSIPLPSCGPHSDPSPNPNEFQPRLPTLNPNPEP